MANFPPLAAIQTAIYARLSGDATLLALAPVTNDATEDQPYPYVLIGNATVEPWYTMGGTSAGWGWNGSVTVHIYSRYEGDQEALQIAERVIALVNFYGFTVSGYNTVICELDPEGSPPGRVLLEYPVKVEQRHVLLRFRVLVHE